MQKIKISDIKIGSRIRSLNLDKVKTLADSIKEIGLIHPILLNKENELISGLHRLEAYKLLELVDIEYNYTEDDNKLKQRLMEIDENLIRNELGYIDRGEHLKERKEIYEELYPGTRHGGDRKSEEIKTRLAQVDSEKSFADDTSEKTGVSTRTIQEDVKIATALDKEEKDTFKEKDISKKEALKFVVEKKKDPEKAEKILEKIQAGETKKIDVAKGIVNTEIVTQQKTLTDITINTTTVNQSKSKLYTIGYSGKEIDDFVKILNQHNIKMLIDVRDSVRSVYKPVFEGGNLQHILQTSGIEYQHFKSLGVIYEVREPYMKGFINDNAFKSWYKWSVTINHHDDLVKASTLCNPEKNICLMCNEKYASPINDQKHYCHRFHLAEILKEYNTIEVIHI